MYAVKFDQNYAEFALETGNIVPLSSLELDLVGGALNWARVGNQALGGGITGGVGGAVAGGVAGMMAGGIGAGPGAFAGGVAGAIGGAIAGGGMELWNQLSASN